ncbi:MAG: hypothetical protein ABIP90_03995 [Vicinamibacterales bacterium]
MNKNRGGIIAARSAVTAAEAAAAQVLLDVEARYSTAFEEHERARVMADAYTTEGDGHAYPQVLMTQRSLAQTCLAGRRALQGLLMGSGR